MRRGSGVLTVRQRQQAVRVWAMRFGEPVEGSSCVRGAPFCLFWAGERSIIDVREGGLLR
jgi:hypothetical protein